MGVLSQVKETMMKSLIVIALVAAVAQASVVETEFVQEGSAPSDDNFSAAQSRVESMLEMDTRARRSACVKAADAPINNVFKEVQNAQRSLNRLDNGRRCASRNQHLINRAQHTIRVLPLWCLAGGQACCEPSQPCRHPVQGQPSRRQEQSYRADPQLQARKLTGDRQKTLLREMMVKCLVAARKKGKGANAAASRCKSLRISAAYSRRLRLFQTKLAAGVAGANCSVGQYRGGGSGINYRGYFYRSLGGAHVHGHANGCDNHFRTIPKGCRVNPSAAVNTYMGKRYRWSTHVLCSVGVCHNTVGYSVAGLKWSNNNIRYSGHCSAAHQRAGRCRAKTNTCSLRILLQCKK